MPVQAEWIRFGEHAGFLARPERTELPLPAVLVIQEIFGVDAHIEDVARRLAAAGYVALAPDLFAERGVRPEALRRERIAEVLASMEPAGAAEQPEAVRKRVEETRAAIFSAPGQSRRFVPVLRAAVGHLRRERPETRGQKIACVGFCMGGALSALLACEEPELSGAAIFYGSAPPLERIPAIPCPVIGFYGALDERINAGLPAFTDAMRSAGKAFERHVYEGAAHGFFNDTRSVYEVGAARDSFARLLDFLRRTTAT
jgi:carboxymethylenebutenolidase